MSCEFCTTLERIIERRVVADGGNARYSRAELRSLVAGRLERLAIEVADVGETTE